uniref:von Willebrand factor D and EGF domain-containing protein isoform X1 n=1 Tax=Scatophagus argus TaxID=75038 RepID=UPI001ED81DEE|nr:von Willebrand factor D and EGF domain-containing protein isoform X1 [Scatophagus argus]
MRFAGLASTALLAALVALASVCSAGSDAPRGVAVGFVFDPKAKCEPPCEHAGVCIRNNTCFCSKGYEGETCQYANCYPKCKNGGECLRPGKCRCPPGFGGRYCHRVTCDGGCWNGGECIAVNGVAKCICPSSWTGSKCQEGLFTAVSNYPINTTGQSHQMEPISQLELLISSSSPRSVRRAAGTGGSAWLQESAAVQKVGWVAPAILLCAPSPV